MGLITDILLLGSAASFFTGFVSLFQKIHIEEKSRFYFLLALLIFGLSLTLGGTDFVAAFNNCAVE